jgi:2-oxoglutarate dehydrogenase E2 component (dihydrolipoamide succinyltransferase)
MANFDIIMPKMGESIEEATITNWFVKEGDTVEEDDVLLEIATDKVDSEIPSPVAGTVKKIFFKQDEVVAVGAVIAVIVLDGDEGQAGDEDPGAVAEEEKTVPAEESNEERVSQEAIVSGSGRFYSPLVRTIATKEGVTQEELDSIEGSGLNGRVRKEDLLNYIESRSEAASPKAERVEAVTSQAAPKKESVQERSPGTEGDEVVEMSRLRKLIAEHMIRSKQTSAHVTNMIEVDVSSVVSWRNRVKDDFLKKEGVKLTYLPVFLEAAADQCIGGRR